MLFQLSRECIGSHEFGDMLRYMNPCYVPVSDEIVHALMMMLIYINKVGKANRLLDIRRKQSGYNSEKFEDIERFIKDFRYSVNCYDIGKYEEGYAVISELFKNYSDNPMLMKLMIRYAFYKNQGSKEEAKKLILEGQRLCPEDGEFLYYNIRFVVGEKNPDILKEEFEKVKSMTNNGMVHLEIEEHSCNSEITPIE